MTYRGHTAIGAVTALGVWNITPPEFMPATTIGRAVIVLMVLLGALAPDLDQPQSYASRHLLGPLRFAVVLFKLCMSNPLTWIMFGRKQVVWIVRHRGFSHSLLGVCLASATLGVAVSLAAGIEFAAQIAAGFALGCLSHLFADALTVSGVPLCLPWSDRRYGLGPRMLRLRSR